MKLKDVDLSQSLKNKGEYKSRLKVLQLELLYIQRHLYQHRKRAIVLFEGWDAAGKGGSIRRFIERLDPRGYNVHSIGAPQHEEVLRHYLHRFWTKLPGPGRFGIFDRSWYGRVLVERVEELCDKPAWQRAYDEINAFERMLLDDGVPVIKLFLHISKDEQLKRFEERKQDPFKNWKLTEDDWRNRERWDDYELAINDMLKKTSPNHSPWHVIASEHKWLGRVSVLEQAVHELRQFFSLPKALPDGWKVMSD